MGFKKAKNNEKGTAFSHKPHTVFSTQKLIRMDVFKLPYPVLANRSASLRAETPTPSATTCAFK